MTTYCLLSSPDKDKHTERFWRLLHLRSGQRLCYKRIAAPRNMHTCLLCVVLCCIASSATGQHRYIRNGRQNGNLQNQMIPNGQQQQGSQMSRYPHTLQIIPLANLRTPHITNANHAQRVLTRNTNANHARRVLTRNTNGGHVPRQRQRVLILYPLHVMSSGRLAVSGVRGGRPASQKALRSNGIVNDHRRIGRPRFTSSQISLVIPRQLRRQSKPRTAAHIREPGPTIRLGPRLSVIYLQPGNKRSKSGNNAGQYSLIHDLITTHGTRQNNIFTKQNPLNVGTYFFKTHNNGRNLQIVRLDSPILGSRQKESLVRDVNLARILIPRRDAQRERSRLQFSYPQNVQRSRVKHPRRHVPQTSKLTNSLKHIARLSGRSDPYLSMYPNQVNANTAAQLQQLQAVSGSNVAGSPRLPLNRMQTATNQARSIPKAGTLQLVTNNKTLYPKGTMPGPANVMQTWTNQARSSLKTGTVQPVTNRRTFSPSMSTIPDPAYFMQAAINQGISSLNTGTLQPVRNKGTFSPSMGTVPVPVNFMQSATNQAITSSGTMPGFTNYVQLVTNKAMSSPSTGTMQPVSNKMMFYPSTGLGNVMLSATNQPKSSLNIGTMQPVSNKMMFYPSTGLANVMLSATNQPKSNLNTGTVQPVSNKMTLGLGTGTMPGLAASNAFANQVVQAVPARNIGNGLTTKIQSTVVGNHLIIAPQGVSPTNSKTTMFHPSNPGLVGSGQKSLASPATSPAVMSGLPMISQNVQALRQMQQNPAIAALNQRMGQMIFAKPGRQNVVPTAGQFMLVNPLQGINPVHPGFQGQLGQSAMSLEGLITQHHISNNVFMGNPMFAPQVGTIVKPNLLMPKGAVVSKVTRHLSSK
ncbi:uncharacterized protein LOC121368136 isoform X2 [Gigantopelta aegis]|uniref:uncharacterized protein LOC121368136 isoform X2 n=1 Tax=Gigantopelta aegis TaxID=1735272 RepID=UPI001B88D547|nr:uncharacterized protein LOC121368136 isoform X2 [Gigantopelta aegis]